MADATPLTGIVARPMYLVDGNGNKYSASLPLSIALTAIQGYVTAYGSNLAATIAATDYVFKWGVNGTAQVNHLMLQNNTPANVQWELDAQTSNGSPLLTPGQTLFLDVQTTVLHLLTAGIQNVNGSSANNIIVRAWM